MIEGRLAPRFDPLENEESILEVVTYHTPDSEQLLRFAEVRAATANFLRVLKNFVPPSADRTAAVRKVREAMFTANAAIALRGKI